MFPSVGRSLADCFSFGRKPLPYDIGESVIPFPIASIGSRRPEDSMHPELIPPPNFGEIDVSKFYTSKPGVEEMKLLTGIVRYFVHCMLTGVIFRLMRDNGSFIYVKGYVDEDLRTLQIIFNNQVREYPLHVLDVKRNAQEPMHVLLQLRQKGAKGKTGTDGIIIVFTDEVQADFFKLSLTILVRGNRDQRKAKEKIYNLPFPEPANPTLESNLESELLHNVVVDEKKAKAIARRQRTFKGPLVGLCEQYSKTVYTEA